MKFRIISSLIILSLILSAFAGCTSSETVKDNPSSQAVVSSDETAPSDDRSDPPEESTSNPPQDDQSDVFEETDFFTENGQGDLPEETVIPSHYVATETKYLYELDIPLPDAEGYNVYEANNILLIFYWDVDDQFCDIISLADRQLIKRIPIAYDCQWGQFADGSFWLIDRTDLAVRFYDTEGNETLVKEGDTSADFVYCHTVSVTADKKYLVTVPTDGSAVEIYDLSSKQVKRLEVPSNMEIWSVYDVKGGIYLDGGYGLGLLYNPETGETQEFNMDNEVNGFYGDIFSCSTEGYIKLGALNSDVFSYIPFDRNGYILDMDYGCVVTSEYGDNALVFWDLRQGVSFTVKGDDNIYGYFVTILNDGTALIFETSENGTKPYVLDMVSAFKDDSVTTAFQPLSCTDGELEQKADEIAEKIYADHGVELLYGSKGNDFDIYDYVAVAELNSYEIYKALSITEEVFNRFPKGMLKESYSDTNKGLKLYLCGDIYGTQSGALDTAGGVATVQDGYITVVLDINEDLWSNIPHEFSHVFDNRIQELSNSETMDWMAIWESATPVDGAYLYSYDDYFDNFEYTKGFHPDHPEDVWFIDAYSRTFPTEDRARLFEFMFSPQGSDIYEYENLVNKAKLYCYILRQCFPSCNTEEPNPWEKHLGVIDETVLPNVEIPATVG